MSPRPPLIKETAATPDFCVIWLHGLGADGSDFLPVVPLLGLPAGAAVRFIFPNAPQIPVTVNAGYVMPAWYDILSMDSLGRQVDRAGILKTRDDLRALIAQENARGIPCSRIVLAGFSQGGAMAYTTALTHPEPLAGIIALSTYIPDAELLQAERHPANAATPVFAGHGDYDDVVSPALGEAARDTVLALGNPVSWYRYPMEHTLVMEEIQDIGAWLGQRL